VQTLRLDFLEFNVEEDTICGYDTVQVFDGESLRSGLLNILCGYNIPDPIVSTGNALRVQFKTDGSNTFDGFTIAYSAVKRPGSGKQNL